MTADVFQKFDKAEQVERAAGSLYRQLAERFRGKSEVAKTLEELASEEDQHALRVRMLRDRYAKRPGDFDDVALDLEAMEALLTEAATLAELFSREPFDLSVDEARRFMIRLEERFAEAHAQAMASAASDDLRTFFEALSRGDTAHARLLASLRD